MSIKLNITGCPTCCKMCVYRWEAIFSCDTGEWSINLLSVNCEKCPTDSPSYGMWTQDPENLLRATLTDCQSGCNSEEDCPDLSEYPPPPPDWNPSALHGDGENKIGGSATEGIDGVYTLRSAGAIRLRVCQLDDDGSSLAWGYTATFSFAPDPGHPAASQGALTVSWPEHHTSTPHVNCVCGEILTNATGTWTITLTHTGYDCCDAWAIIADPCTDHDCPTYDGS